MSKLGLIPCRQSRITDTNARVTTKDGRYASSDEEDLFCQQTHNPDAYEALYLCCTHEVIIESKCFDLETNDNSQENDDDGDDEQD